VQPHKFFKKTPKIQNGNPINVFGCVVTYFLKSSQKSKEGRIGVAKQ
jgi:hypothetical protein